MSAASIPPLFSPLLSGMIFLLFAMASVFCIGRTAVPDFLTGKYGLPPTTQAYQIEQEEDTQKLSDLKSFLNITLLYDDHKGTIYLFDPAQYYYQRSNHIDVDTDGYFTDEDYKLGNDRTVSINRDFRDLRTGYRIDSDLLQKENVSELHNFFALSELKKDGTIYLYSYDQKELDRAVETMQALETVEIPYSIHTPWLFGIYSGIFSDFKSALVVVSAWIAVFFLFTLLLFCPKEIELSIFGRVVKTTNPCSEGSVKQSILRMILEFVFSLILLMLYGIPAQYATQYALSITIVYELVLLIFILGHVFFQKRKIQQFKSSCPILILALELCMMMGSSMLLVVQLILAIIEHKNLNEFLFILVYLGIPLGIECMLALSLLKPVLSLLLLKKPSRWNIFWQICMIGCAFCIGLSALILPWPSIAFYTMMLFTFCFFAYRKLHSNILAPDH